MAETGNSTSRPSPELAHCVTRIRQIVAEGRDDRRAILQLGYNLGRLSELTGQGRRPFWDAWKDAVADWDPDRLAALAHDLHIRIGGCLPETGEPPHAAEPDSPMTAATTSHSARRRAALLSLAVGFLMLFGKWTAFVITGSYAILSDALESVVHVVATAFAFASIVLAARPPDLKYPYGYGKIGFFSAGFEGGLISLAGVAILYEAGVALIHGSQPTRLDLGMLLIAIAAGINLWLGVFLIRLGKKENSLILVADGQHVLADSYTSFGVLIGVVLVWITGLSWLDALVAIGFGLNILWTGWTLVRESFSGLMDRADPVLLGRVVGAIQAAREPGWIDLHQLRAWQAGDRVFVDFHLAVPSDWTVAQVHDTNDRLHDLLRDLLGEETELIVHFDPDRPDFDAGRPWTVETATRIPGTLSDSPVTIE